MTVLADERLELGLGADPAPLRALPAALAGAGVDDARLAPGRPWRPGITVAVGIAGEEEEQEDPAHALR